MAVVEFTKDIYPYCKGDTIELSPEERADVDRYAEQHGVEDPYTVVDEAEPQVSGEASVVAGNNEGDDASTDGDSDEASNGGPSIQDLRTEAKALGLSAGGSKADLQACIDEAKAKSAEGEEEDSVEE